MTLSPRRATLPWFLSLAVALGAACGGAGGDGLTIAHGTIGPAGGVLQGGGVTVRVPAGALTADAMITVEKVAGALTVPQPGLDVVTTYRLGPARTTFSKPVAVAFSIEPATLPAGATANGTALVLVHAAEDGSDAEVAGIWVAGQTTLAGLATSFALFEVAVLSTTGVGRCPIAADVTCPTDLTCDVSGVCGGACNVVVGAAGHELACSSGGATTITCACHGPTATANDAFQLPPFLGPDPAVRLVWEYLRHCEAPCPDAGATDAGATDAGATDAAGDAGDASPLF